jgi:hypothetical protein
MKLQGRIPVEPLDDERLTNIERRLVVSVSEMSAQPTRAPRRALAFAGAAMAVAIAGVIGWKLHEPPAVAPTVAAEQHVQVKTDAEHSTLVLDGATIASDPATAFEVTRSAERVVVAMTRGKVDLVVTHQPGRRFVIRAGETEIEDIGTRFTVDYDGKDHVDVRVTEGEVKVTRHQQAIRVAAGSAWTTDRGLVALAELADKPVTTSGDGSGSATVVAVATKGPPTDLLHDRVAAVPPPPAKKLGGAAVVRKPVATSAQVHRDPHADKPSGPVDPYVDLKIAIRQQPLAFDPGVDGKSDAGNEVAKLKKVAYSPSTVGAEASQALYQMAVLLYRPLGQENEALRTLDVYRRRFSRGKEMTAALWLRVRILCSHTIDEECRKAAYTYQHEVTTGDAATVAIRITNAQ